MGAGARSRYISQRLIGQTNGFDNVISASQMNKELIVFLKSEALENQLTVDGLWVKEAFVPVSPLSAPATKITISNVPPFVSNDVIVKELLRYGKIASPMRTIPLGCKNAALKHVLSFRRQIFMFLSSQDRSLEVSFRVKHEDNSYMVYASTESLKCFDCGDVGHKRFSCPHKVRDEPSASRDEESNGESQVIERNKQDSVLTDRVTEEEVKEQEKVSAVVSKSVSNDQPGCSYAVGKPASACGVTDKVVNECSVEDVQQHSLVTQAKCSEEDTGEEMDGLSQSTEDGVRDEQWAEMERARESDLYTVDQINSFLDETKGKAGVEIVDFFPDLEKFVSSVAWARKMTSCTELSQQKRFRLKKYITSARQKLKLVGKEPLTRGNAKDS